MTPKESHAALHAAFSEYASKRWGQQEWSDFGRGAGIVDILSDHPRLYRSLSFNDPDYPDAVWGIVPQALAAAAASDSVHDEMALVAEFVPGLPAWISGPEASYRTRKRFQSLLEATAVLPDEWGQDSPAPLEAPPADLFGSAEGQKFPWEVSSQEGAEAPLPPTKAEPLAARSEPVAGPTVPSREGPTMASIFIVHGHDSSAVNDVKVAVYEMTGIMPEILADSPGRGDTIIEKFERRANDATFAIVLLTPDDVGRAKAAGDLNPRARQNVVLELGYFFGQLGRQNVAVLNAGVEQPSDVNGINYITYPGQNWKYDLHKELRAVGLATSS
jgi:hypothetical protein